ncbi:MAG: TonB-dependent receptor [Vicinamibacteria bacterium]|nr:TonB-dependent receptor [Vicinamibacteria bacterium]
MTSSFASKAAIAACVLVTINASADEERRSGAILGVIMDETIQAPLAGVVVTMDDVGQSVETNADGRFELQGVPAGSHRLFATRTGYFPKIETDVVVTRGRDTLITIRMQAAPRLTEEVDVQASSFSRSGDTASSAFSMSYEELRRAPGAFGGDITRLVQSLPGLIARDDMRNDVVSRGGNPAENLVLVDGIETPGLSHFGSLGAATGGVSMVNAELVGDVSFMAGGFPAQYGDRLSSVLEVWLREGNRRRFASEFDLSMAGAGFVLEGPLGGRGSWMASGRRSYVDLIAGAFDASGMPVYANYQTKLVYDLDDRNKLSLMSLGGWEDIRVRVEDQDEDDTNTLDADQTGWRTTTGLSWRALMGATGASTVSVAHSLTAYDTVARDLKLGGALVSDNRSRERQLSLKHDLAFSLGATMLRTGWSMKRQSVDFERASPLGEEDPYSTDPTRVNAYTFDERSSAMSGDAYLHFSRPLTKWATLSLGGRYDYFDINASSTVAPRASIVFHPLSRIDLSASVGRYYQMPALVYMKSHAENLALEPIRADHVVAGAAYYPSSDVKLTIEAYDKRYSDYPVARDFPYLSLANKGNEFDISLFLAPLVSSGEGRARGVELYLQKKFRRGFYGQVSYAFSKTEHVALDGVRRLADVDLPHVFQLVGGVKITPSFEISTHFCYSSGPPMTPLIADESRAQNRMVLDFNRINAERAPLYHRLDVRLDRRFSFGWGNFVAYIEVDNVYDRKNIRFETWNSNTRQREFEYQAGLLPIAGINVEF